MILSNKMDGENLEKLDSAEKLENAEIAAELEQLDRISKALGVVKDRNYKVGTRFQEGDYIAELNELDNLILQEKLDKERTYCLESTMGLFENQKAQPSLEDELAKKINLVDEEEELKQLQ